MRTQARVHKSEQGMASFIVTFVLMMIISLVVLSFAQITRREQRQALDRHLSSRAFYAAEAGVNSAVNAIKNGYSAAKDNCGPDPSGPLDSSAYVLDGLTGTELNCLTLDLSPPNLEWPNVSKNQSLIVPINPVGGLDRLEFSWQSTSATPATSYAACSAANGFMSQAAWGCAAPVIRLDMVPTGGGLNRNGLTSSVYSVFFYPTAGGGTANTNYVSGSRGAIVNARCSAANAPYDCNVRLNIPSGQYYARIVTRYADAKLMITPRNGGGSVELTGAQAIIDSTGKASDVTRRLQVRKSLNGANMPPEFALESAAGLCKRYVLMAGNGTPGSTVLNLSAAGTLHDGGPCAID